MIRTFCDKCNIEIKNDNSSNSIMSTEIKYKTKYDPTVITIELLGKADICKHCVLDALNDLDDRPRKEAQS